MNSESTGAIATYARSEPLYAGSAASRFRSIARSEPRRSSSTTLWSANFIASGNRVVSRRLVDEPVHLLTDTAIRRMPLRGRAQLDQVHRFARVHLHVEADAVGHHHGVLRR